MRAYIVKNPSGKYTNLGRPDILQFLHHQEKQHAPKNELCFYQTRLRGLHKRVPHIYHFALLSPFE